MLESVTNKVNESYIQFSKVKRAERGKGLCYCYKASIRNTKYDKPFVLLLLRDIDGRTVPGYVFDLSSPLLAGKEAVEAEGHVVSISYEENFLDKQGLTVIVNTCSIVKDISAQELSKFAGSIPNIEWKLESIMKVITDTLSFKVTLPLTVTTYASADFEGGRVGGLTEHYYQMAKILESVGSLSTEERRRLIATFVLYIYAHSNYMRAKDRGEDDVTLIVELTNKLSGLESKLCLGPGCREVVHTLFGVAPKDIYVRTVFHVAESVQRISKEFEKYQTLPIAQEGDAGYGFIRRYQAEDATP